MFLVFLSGSAQLSGDFRGLNRFNTAKNSVSVAPRLARLVVQVLRRAPLYVAAATAGLTCRAAALELSESVLVGISEKD